MRVEFLELTNFRSYGAARFELHPEVTLVVGPNASGKTNLLESLYVMASTRSFRAKDRELVREGEDFYRIVAHSGDSEYVMALNVAGGGAEKSVRHDGVRRPLASHVGRIQVILFEPSELDLVSGPPEALQEGSEAA
jgi:DNA replication and repair protein RecF